MNYQSRWQSPVVWIATLTVLLSQIKAMQDSGFTPVNIAVAVITIAIAFLGALNNPENKDSLS
jgi:hypothetical protein